MNNQNNNYKIIDGTLDVIHKTQESLWKKSKDLDWQEKVRQINDAVKNYKQGIPSHNNI